MRRTMALDAPTGETLSLGLVSGLLDLLDTPILVADRVGRILIANKRALECLGEPATDTGSAANLFNDLLRMDPKVIIGQIENGEHEVDLQLMRPSGKLRARIEGIPELDWLLVRLEAVGEAQPEIAGQTSQPTVQALLQEREITYRNLLSAYLRLQEVNRQKTLFLASAAHELKTPLAVIKGYYDLLLSGSLGKLNDKQRDILQESKDSCDRLVRLVSMFLNYSALESGKLVLHMRENDLRDCLIELATRWNGGFSAQARAYRSCDERPTAHF